MSYMALMDRPAVVDIGLSDNATECPSDKVKWYHTATNTLFTPSTRKQKLLCAAFWVCLAACFIALFAWLFPKFVDDGMVPFVDKLKQNLRPLDIALICFGGYVTLPMVFLPTSPFLWLAGMVFHFGECVALFVVAAFVGMSLPFLLARTYLQKPVHKVLHRYRSTEITLKAVDKAGPWKVLILLRLGPVPYPVVNYGAAIPKSIKYHQYIIASVIAEMPHILLNIYFGRNMQGIAALLRGKVTNPLLLAWNLVSGGVWNGREAVLLVLNAASPSYEQLWMHVQGNHAVILYMYW